MTFKNFLSQKGYGVETSLQPTGELYVINGKPVHYRDISKSEFAGIHRQYLASQK